ncbi:MAG: Flp pilus assembly protein CpaB [Candidatus Binatia bacterium]
MSVSSSSRNRAILLVAAVFGIFSAVLVFAFLSSQGSSDSADSPLSDALSQGEASELVVVATRDILPGETIRADMLTTKAMPLSVLVEGVALDQDELVGKVATAPIFVGEQVLTAKATTYEGQNTLAYKVPEGMRALSLMVPHEAWNNAGLAQPGDRVDVLGVTVMDQVDPLTGQEKPQVLAGIVAEDVEVLAVAQTALKIIPNTDVTDEPTASDSGTIGLGGTDGVVGEGSVGAGAESTSSGETPRRSASAEVGQPGDEAATYQEAISVTLAVPPDVAAKILIIDALKDDVAQYRIVTRQKGDEGRVTGTATWTLEDVFEPVR